MPRRSRGPHLALVLYLLGLSSPARAECDAVIQLARIHDGFFAITREQGDRRTRFAARLYPQLANLDVQAFANTITTGPDRDAIAEAIAAARDLARELITNTNISPFRILDSRDEVAVLSQFIDRSGCLGNDNGQAKPASTSSASAPGANGTLQFGPKTRSNSSQSLVRTEQIPILALLIAGGTLGLGAAGLLLARSRRVKIYRADRQPRHRISLAFSADCTGEDGSSATHTVRALDVSVGGMKLKVPKPLAQGTALNFALPIGPANASVIWSNAHYAGILFDEFLSEDDLKTLLAAG